MEIEDKVQSLVRKGQALVRNGKFEKSLVHFRKALAMSPNNMEIYERMGDAISSIGTYEGNALAVALFEKVISKQPNNVKIYFKMATAFQRLGDLEKSRSLCRKALTIDPNSISAQWHLAVFQIPYLYENEEEITLCRKNYLADLKRTLDMVTKINPGDLDSTIRKVQMPPPSFLLTYQANNDKKSRRLGGDLLTRFVNAKYPQWAARPSLSPRKQGQPIRVGIVSNCLRRHVHWNVIIKGWFENLDRDRFSLFGYHLNSHIDEVTKTAKRLSTRFVDNEFSFKKIASTILADKLHVLIYPELGLDRRTIKLAALRLAPVQCISWGCSTTYGLPAVDYYLSNELMEPQNAQEHYSEHLVKLPNIGICYTPPRFPTAKITYADLGLPSDEVIFFCGQNLMKYLPQYDDIFPRIARKVKKCRFVFLLKDTIPKYIKLFQKRLNQAFAKYNMAADEYTIYFPRLSKEKYHSLLGLCDVSLDTIEYSGCHTTLEAISNNLPIVTLPGEFMRGRQSYGILKMMGVTETVASSIDEYVEIAVELANNPQWREKVANRMENEKHKVFGDLTCIRALEDFLENAVIKTT